jgi:hypothetical protein
MRKNENESIFQEKLYDLPFLAVMFTIVGTLVEEAPILKQMNNTSKHHLQIQLRCMLSTT